MVAKYFTLNSAITSKYWRHRYRYIYFGVNKQNILLLSRILCSHDSALPLKRKMYGPLPHNDVFYNHKNNILKELAKKNTLLTMSLLFRKVDIILWILQPKVPFFATFIAWFQTPLCSITL